jgi:hypothetical protein
MFDPYSGVEVVRNLLGYLVNKKILNGSCLDKQPHRYDKDYQYQQGGATYFPDFSQGYSVGCKINYKALLSKFNTIEL